MLKTAIDDGSQNFRLQKKIPETGAVDRNVRSLYVLLGLLGRLRGNLLGLILILVVQKIVIIGHFFEMGQVKTEK